MQGSRGRIGPGGVKGQRPLGVNFALLKLKNWPLLDRSWLKSEGSREFIRKKYKYITYFFLWVNALYHSSKTTPTIALTWAVTLLVFLVLVWVDVSKYPRSIGKVLKQLTGANKIVKIV